MMRAAGGARRQNGFNGRAALLAGQGYAVFHPSVNLVAAVRASHGRKA